MSNSYRTLIERLRQFADGHYIIQKFYHGQIDAADLDKEPRYPMMHVLPVDIRASTGTLDYALEIRFADIGRDKEIKTDYQKEIISDMSRIALSLISEIENGEILFGEEAEIVDKQATIIPFIEEFTHVLTGVQLNVTIRLPFNWSACDIPADYSPNITDNPTTGSGILTKIGIYNDGAFVGYTSFVDFSDDFNVSINGNKIEVTLAGGGGGGAVEGVTGNIVNNTDPANPIVTQVQPDWNAGSGLGQILNKPSIPSAQVNSDWNATSGVAEILNKPTSLPPSGSAGGDLTGSYPNPTVSKIHGIDVQNGTASDGQILKYHAGENKWKHHTQVKADVGLDNVDNTSDLNKPISTATQAALDNLNNYTEIIRAGASIPASTTRWLVPGLSGFGTSLVVNIAERAIHTSFRVMTGSAQPANGNMTITRQFTTPTGTALQSDVLTIPAGSAIGVYEFTGSNFDATAIDCNLKFTFVNNGTSSSASVQGLERTFTK